MIDNMSSLKYFLEKSVLSNPVPRGNEWIFNLKKFTAKNEKWIFCS